MSFFPLFPSALISTYQQIFHKPLPESAVFVQSDTASACQCGSTDRPLLAVSGPSRQELCRTWSSPAGTVLYLVLPVRVCAVPGPLRQGLCRAGPSPAGSVPRRARKKRTVPAAPPPIFLICMRSQSAAPPQALQRRPSWRTSSRPVRGRCGHRCPRPVPGTNM